MGGVKPMVAGRFSCPVCNQPYVIGDPYHRHARCKEEIEMAKVAEKQTVKHDEKVYGPGEEVPDLTDEQEKALLDAGAIEGKYDADETPESTGPVRGATRKATQ